MHPLAGRASQSGCVKWTSECIPAFPAHAEISSRSRGPVRGTMSGHSSNLRIAMKHAGHFLVYILLRVVVSIIQALSMETCHGGVRLLAYVLCDVVKFRAKTI